MSVAAENGRDEALGVGLFGGGSVGDHAPTEASAHQRRRSWCAARDGHADAAKPRAYRIAAASAHGGG